MASPLNVGIIGVNPAGGWAAEAHVPAVQAVSGLRLASVATRDPHTADDAARRFGAAKGYGSGAALIDDPQIDVVTVATRVPQHRELLLAAIAAGKHVYSEWPLGLSISEAQAIAEAARRAGVRHAIGLQLRGSPTVQQAQRLLAAGAIGRILSIRTYSSTAGFGPDVPAPFAYLEDPANFANLVTIQGAHTLDLLLALGGPLLAMAALTSRQYPQVRVGEPRQPAARRTFDHLLMHGHLATEVPFTLEVVGGCQQGTPFYLEIVGEAGTLRLDGGAPRGVQSGRLGMLRDGERLSVDEGPLAPLSDSAVNVAGTYSALRDDILTGGRTVIDFDHAVRLTQLMQEVLQGNLGLRVSEGLWP